MDTGTCSEYSSWYSTIGRDMVQCCCDRYLATIDVCCIAKMVSTHLLISHLFINHPLISHPPTAYIRLQGQNIVYPVVIASLGATVVNVCCNYMSMTKYHYGFLGVAVISALTQWAGKITCWYTLIHAVILSPSLVPSLALMYLTTIFHITLTHSVLLYFYSFLTYLTITIHTTFLTTRAYHTPLLSTHTCQPSLFSCMWLWEEAGGYIISEKNKGNTPYQYTYQHTLLTHPVNPLYQYTLLTHPINIPSQHPTITHLINTPY